MKKQHNLTKINVIYATETGTAYDLAKQFVLIHNKDLTINKFVNISTIQKFDEIQSNCLWIFFVATSGQGDFTYSMKNIWKKMLSKSHPNLNWMKFTIYSFGDRSYGDNFCLAARKFRQRLIGLQAQQVVEIGLGDQQEANGYLQQFRDKWFPNLSNYLRQNNLFVKARHEEKERQESSESSQKMTQTTFNYQNILMNNENEFDITIVNREQICSNKDRRIFTIDLQIVNYPNKILPGDILSIYPHNNPEDVNYLLKHFGLKQQDIYMQKKQSNYISTQNKHKSDKSNNILQSSECQMNLTYYKLFKQHLNISSTLNHSFFVSRQDIPKLSDYLEQSQVLFKQKLIELENDYDQFHNYIKKYKRNVVQVLIDFQLDKLNVNDFIKRCGQIIPRKYSISQVLQNTQNKKVVRILFKLVKDKINQNRMHQGVCSHDLALHSNIGQIRRGNVLKGQFEYNETNKNNIILITLGTGIAPFIQLFDMAKKSQKQWNIQLYYTNRYQNQVYFQSFLQDLVAQNKLNPFLSFTGEGGKRIIRLVQNNIQAIKQFINRFGINNIKIMTCGPKEVCQGLQNILSRDLESLGVNIKELKKKRVFIYENW